MKKLISLTLALALATVFAAGCKRKGRSPCSGSGRCSCSRAEADVFR